MRLKIILLITLAFPAIAQKTLVYDDRTYDPLIKTVLCYPLSEDGNTLQPAVTRFEAQNLVVEFDDLQEQRANYYVKLIHCNYDWTKSTLMDLDIMRDYNEFTISDYTFSVNTHIPYVHYRFKVPTVKIPGNYLVIVYRDGNRQDLVISRRIAIFSPRVDFVTEDNLAGLGNIRNTNQALNFVVNYGQTELINPMESLHVVIRQNHRWDNAKMDVKPTFIRENSNQLEFRFFDMDKTFRAGNEFRFVDFKSLNYPGRNTLRLDKSRKPYELFVTIDGVRGSEAYSQYPDLDGNFYVDNADYQDEPWITANYLYANFSLQSPKLKNDVYLIGAYNGWRRSEENKLVYNDGVYAKRILLKQGFYNYQYWVDSPDAEANQIEGDYFQTENVYEVLVYYRPFQPTADLLIGYFVIPVNPR